MSIFLVNALSKSAQEIDIDTIFDKIKSRYENYKNFKCKALLSLDIPNIRIPDKKVIIYYKKPGEVEIEAKGFSIVPNLSFLPLIFLDSNWTEIRKPEIKKKKSQSLYVHH